MSTAAPTLRDACTTLEVGPTSAEIAEARWEVGLPMFKGAPSWPRAGRVCLEGYAAELHRAHALKAPTPRLDPYHARRAVA